MEENNKQENVKNPDSVIDNSGKEITFIKNNPAQNTQKTEPSGSAKKVASSEKTSAGKAEKTAKTQKENTKNDKKIAKNKKPEPVNQKAMKITADRPPLFCHSHKYLHWVPRDWHSENEYNQKA